MPSTHWLTFLRKQHEAKANVCMSCCREQGRSMTVRVRGLRNNKSRLLH